MQRNRRSFLWLGLSLTVACAGEQDAGDEADVIASAARKAKPEVAQNSELKGEGESEAGEPGSTGSLPFEGELACPRGGNSGPVRVVFGCDQIVVVTCKDLSNLVIGFADGTRTRFEGQRGHVNTFALPAGAEVAAVWVKAGANASGEGPGYGERVDAPAERCVPTVPEVPGTPDVQEEEEPTPGDGETPDPVI